VRVSTVVEWVCGSCLPWCRAQALRVLYDCVSRPELRDVTASLVVISDIFPRLLALVGAPGLLRASRVRTTLNTVLEALLQDVPGIDAAVALASPALPVRWCDAIQQRIGEALATDPSLQYESTAEMVGSALPTFGAPPSMAASAIVGAGPVDANPIAPTVLATAGGAALLQPIVLSTQRMSNLHLATVQEAVRRQALAIYLRMFARHYNFTRLRA